MSVVFIVIGVMIAVWFLDHFFNLLGMILRFIKCLMLGIYKLIKFIFGISKKEEEKKVRCKEYDEVPKLSKEKMYFLKNEENKRIYLENLRQTKHDINIL